MNDSAPIDELVANSTIDIAQSLSAARSLWRHYKILIATLFLIFAFAAITVIGSASAVPPVAAFVMTAGMVLVLGSVTVHGCESSTVSLEYELSAEQSARLRAWPARFLSWRVAAASGISS